MTRRLLVLLATAAVVAASCSLSEPSDVVTTATTLATVTTLPPTTTTTTSPPTTTTTTTSPPTTTTTLPPIEVFDTVNGLGPLTDAPLGVIAIKIDNHQNARPHTGLQYADIVYELPVEYGLTRFIAIYDRHEVDKAGPVRSLRPTDSAIVNPIAIPLQISGGSNWVLAKARKQGMKLLPDAKRGTYRDNTRKAPHNLYADTEVIRDYVEGRWGNVAPGNMFVYGEADELEEQATTITIPFSHLPPSVWEWDPEMNLYLHSYGDTPHLTYEPDELDSTPGAGQQVTVDTLIVILAEFYTAKPDKPSDGIAVPAMDLSGTGEALVMHDGQLGHATWVRERTEDPITLVHDDGTPVVIEPGVIWVSIVPTRETITWE